MTEPIRPWTQYASEEWDRMTRADPTPLEPWSWTCGTCGAEMPRDAIPGHDQRDRVAAGGGRARAGRRRDRQVAEVTPTDRLAALLHAEDCWPDCGNPKEVPAGTLFHRMAARLIDAGVTLAATPAPLDVDVRGQLDLLIHVAQDIVRDAGTEKWPVNLDRLRMALDEIGALDVEDER